MTSDASNGQKSSTRARVVMVPTRLFDQKMPIEPLEKIIDWRKASSATRQT